ncbi:hypothetical protein PPL_12641 [Rhizophagus irregularis DAOM 181602=DAOM 197198]|nr:hypothetical protein PPL_12641 [Rhizophagus irregularis DAOM 181602=DAOM 197198]
MSHLENYYKYYNLSGVPARILKGEEHYNLYKKPLKEKSTERPKVIVWKPNATHQADLAEMPVDPKGFHYFLVVTGDRLRIRFTNDQVRDFFLNSLGVMMRFGEPGRHKQQSYAERAIQAIQEPLLKRMVAQELKTGVTSVEWSEDFHNIVSKVNELWQRNPQTFRQDHPKCQKRRISSLKEHVSESRDIRWNPNIRVSRCAYTRKELQEDVPDLIRKFWE